MLESLLIQNFQSHDKTRVDFDPGITTIVGPSDIGKSAILRALRWVCANDPGGDAFIRHGAKGATVKLMVDGRAITRRRSPGGGVNEYLLDEQEFKAFNRGVPEPITRHLNLGPVCWQGQHDAPYWFAETAGEVSRQLNSIVNLGVIDDVLARVAAARTRARTRLDMAEEGLTTSKRTYDGLAWADAFDGAVVRVEGFERLAAAGTVAAAGLRGLHDEAVRLGVVRDNAAGVAQAGQNAVKCGADATAKRHTAYTIAADVAQAHRLKKVTAWAVPDITDLDALNVARVGAEWRRDALRYLIDDAIARKGDVCRAEKELKEAEAKMPKTCPLCGR